MKKILIVLLAFSMMLSTFACGMPDYSNPTDAPTQQETEVGGNQTEKSTEEPTQIFSDEGGSNETESEPAFEVAISLITQKAL